MPRRIIAEVKVLDVQKRRTPNKHYVSGWARGAPLRRARPRPDKGRAETDGERSHCPGAAGSRRAGLLALPRGALNGLPAARGKRCRFAPRTR